MVGTLATLLVNLRTGRPKLQRWKTLVCSGINCLFGFDFKQGSPEHSYRSLADNKCWSCSTERTRGGRGSLNKAVIVRLYLRLLWYAQQELERTVHPLMIPITLRSNKTQQFNGNGSEISVVRMVYRRCVCFFILLIVFFLSCRKLPEGTIHGFAYMAVLPNQMTT